jgi:hypothetical protein
MFYIGPRKQHGMIQPSHLYDAIVLPLSGKPNVTLVWEQFPMCTFSWLDRYLMKICDQVLVFISSEHAETLVWGDEDEDDTDTDNEESDRLFTFEVAKTNEQEENVSIRPGFQVLRLFLRLLL